jgi:hypothetical protein
MVAIQLIAFYNILLYVYENVKLQVIARIFQWVQNVSYW